MVRRDFNWRCGKDTTLRDGPREGGDAALNSPPTRLTLDPRHCRRTGFSIDYLRASAPQFRKASFKKLEYHSPLEGESQKPEPNGEGFCGGGFAQGEPRARSCAPSRVRTSQPTGEGRSGGGQAPPPGDHNHSRFTLRAGLARIPAPANLSPAASTGCRAGLAWEQLEGRPGQ